MLKTEETEINETEEQPISNGKKGFCIYELKTEHNY